MKRNILTVTLFILSPLAHSSEASFKTWKRSYPLKVELMGKSFSPDTAAIATSNGKGWTWLDEGFGSVVNVFPIGDDKYLKMTTSVQDMVNIAEDLKKNSSWKLDTGKSTFHWVEDRKKCEFTQYIKKHEQKLQNDGFKLLGDKDYSEHGTWKQSYINGKNSLSLNISKDKEFCHRKLLFTENKY